jgi:NAD(P)-dependent dehydrogenase (short-subunit alcohol dehydrogenase family)
MRSEHLFDVAGLATIVTGAASGLGLAYAEAMAENGARVLLVDQDADGLARETARLRAEGHAADSAALDVTDASALRAVIDGAVERFGRLDVVFANAGMSGGPGTGMPGGQIDAVPDRLWRRVLDVNLTAAFDTLRFAAAHMKRQRSGRLIVTASIAGMKSSALSGYPYLATKAALINIVRQAAVELGPHNVLVNAIAPGLFLTNIAGGRLKHDAALRAELEAQIPLRRAAEPDEIKGLALLLASPAGGYINGAVIPIDGGRVA